MTRFQIAGAVAAVVLAVLWLARSAWFDPEVPFIRTDTAAAWITYDRPVALETLLVGRPFAARAEFSVQVAIAAPAETSSLQVEALGEVAGFVNDTPIQLASGDRACFKTTCTVELESLLRPGDNTFRFEVVNPSGPPLLRVRSRPAPARIATGREWRVALDGGAPAPAIVADDTRPFTESAGTKTPARALADRAPTLLALFAASAALFVFARRRLPGRFARHLPELALAAIAMFWIFLFVTRFIQLPPHWGYDAKFHVEYVHFILDEGRLPLASDGFSMYHPPLFYSLAAGLVAAFDPARGTVAEQAVLKIIPLLCGFGMVWIAFALMRRLFPDDPRPAFFATVFAGTLPVNLYMAGYVSNEPLFALLTGLALWVAARLLLEPELPYARLAVFTSLLGLALMTKYTALITVPVFVFFLGFAAFFADRFSTRRTAAVCASVLAGAFAIGGWVYVRNWIHFGDPLIWNLDVPGALLWWQTPGFRTLDYYLGFGESLHQPYFSLFHSFGDALYSATWGDGAPPSIYHLDERHSFWNYDAMTSAYLLALPATALVGFGIVTVARKALRGNDMRRRAFFTLVAALLFVVAFSVVSLSLRFPFWGALRASYALAAVVPAAVCAGVGATRFDSWLARRFGTPARALFYGWFGAFVATLVAAFGT